MSDALTIEARKAIAALELVIRAREITVPTAAKLLKKKPEWIRENLPIVVYGPKSHHVRLQDVEAYQLKRTVWPKFERDNGK